MTTPKTVYLKDYRPTDYQIDETDLRFEIGESSTKLLARLKVARRKGVAPSVPLILDGMELRLLSVSIDGVPIKSYKLTPENLTLDKVPAKFLLTIETEIDPSQNKSGMGLYRSGSTICTQMEAEGFRRITYFLDRPDVLSLYTTTIIADQKQFPCILSNGNRINYEVLGDGRHSATWHDPFPKPCYLFALVAGDLALIEDHFTTISGKKVKLQIFVDRGNEKRTAHAMKSLKKAMRWDEEVFGLEYDLDIFMLVAVDSFNFGAMENKGLNIFNSAYVMADPETATDKDYMDIEGIIGHEYFHNWTGDRVTCRDWFQLTLKEGLTIFRDQEFSSDLNSRAVCRIDDVRNLRVRQFTEDAGPNAHPIRPQSYINIDNFYTATVYGKGGEVIRMVETLIGKEKFKAGIRKYFELYDGQAVTCDDFINAMQIASGFDFSQFKLWYSQAGTPRLKVRSNYDQKCGEFELIISQSCPQTSGLTENKPFHLPIAIGLLGSDGEDLPLQLAGENASTFGTKILQLREREQRFVFTQIKEKPVPSLLRNFSAPVYTDYPYSEDELGFLLANDSDLFNRCEAGQQLSLQAIRGLMVASSNTKPAEALLKAFAKLLSDKNIDPAFKAEVFNLPSLEIICAGDRPVDFERSERARDLLIKQIAESLNDQMRACYHSLASELRGKYQIDPISIGKRKLKNTILDYLMTGIGSTGVKLGFEQFKSSNNMTDCYEALRLLAHTDSQERSEALSLFYKKWKDNGLVIDKWFMVQALSKRDLVLDDIKTLESDPAFDRTNPNKLRSLFGAFGANYVRFHQGSGAGYRFMAEKIIEIDRYNSNVSGRMSTLFSRFAELDSSRKKLMREALEGILKTPKLSNAVYEIISKTVGT